MAKNSPFATSCACALVAFLFMGCNVAPESHNVPVRTTAENKGPGLANPAAVYCEEQGHRLESHTAADGSQSAVCVLPDGTECDEWAYFRGECGPATAAPAVRNRVVEVTKSLLAEQLGIEPNQIALFSLEKINWPDSCLGIPGAGEICIPVETPGFRVILEARGDHYTYHTDLACKNIRRETAGTQGG